jgi:four helix bundle protein
VAQGLGASGGKNSKLPGRLTVQIRSDATMTKVLSFRDLDAWNAAMDLVVSTYDVCKAFPRDEKYGLARQMQRAATSVPSNVAEGHAHGPGLRFRNHVRIALGSLAELSTELEIAIRLKYVAGDAVAQIEAQLVRTRQLLNGLHRSLRQRLLARGVSFVVLVSAGVMLLS